MGVNSAQSGGEETLPAGKSRSTFWQFLFVLTNWKWFILVWFAGIMIVVTIVLLLVPRWYKAEASVLPPKESNILNGLSGLSSVMQSVSPLLSRTGIGSSSPTYTYLAILNSRSVMDSVIRRFDLVSVYNISSYPLERTEKELRENSIFDIDENDALNITVLDKDANRAADMANYFVTLLNQIFVKVSVEEAHNNRLFLQQRYEKNLVDLRGAEDTLQAFQQRFKIYDMPEQAKAAIAAGADLEAQRIAADVQLGVMRQQYGEDAPQVKLKKLEVQQLSQKLEDMQTGSGSDFNKGASVLPAFKNVPELGIAYLRLYRDYEIQTKLLEFTLPLYEQAKIEEQKDTPAVIVLDKAIPPERPTVPKRMFIEIIFAFVALSFLVYFVHVLERVKSQTDHLNSLEIKLQHYATKAARRFRVKDEVI
jgi:capsule polysaccharide export protein KpsE/RkpR